MIHDIARPKLAAKFVDIYREHIPDIDPFPETIELLKLLQGAYKIGLVSDGYLAVQQAKWQALGLAEYFNAVVFSDSLGRENWKPSTAPFKLVLDKLGVEPASSVYIGDNPHKDFLGARQIGMYAIQVKRADAEYGNLEPPGLEYQPHLIVDSIADVLMAIDRL